MTPDGPGDLRFRPDPAEFAALAKEHAIVPVRIRTRESAQITLAGLPQKPVKVANLVIEHFLRVLVVTSRPVKIQRVKDRLSSPWA